MGVRRLTWSTVGTVLLAGLALSRAIWLVAQIPAIARRVPHSNDFGSFFFAAEQWRHGGSLYSWPAAQLVPPNLNPPHWTLLVLPFTALPASMAYVTWLALSVCAFVLGLVLVRRTEPREWTTREVVALAAAALWSQPLMQTLFEGQLSWLLMLGLVCAWRAEVRRKPAAEGLWLAALLSVKPFLAPLLVRPALRRDWATLLWTAIGLGAIAAIGVAVFGAAAYGSWVAELGRVTWVTHWANVSVVGWWRRQTWPFVEAGIWASGLIVVIATAAVVLRERPSRDRAWALLIMGGLLVSPLAWSHYLWLAAPFLLTTQPWRARPLLTAIVGTFLIAAWMNPPSDPTPMTALTTASFLTYAAVLIWVGLIVGGSARVRAHS